MDPNRQTAADETTVAQYRAADAQITGNFLRERAQDAKAVSEALVAGVELAVDTYMIVDGGIAVKRAAGTLRAKAIERAAARTAATDGAPLGEAAAEGLAPSNGAKYVFDATAGRYRDATTGRFAAASDLPWPPNGGFASSARETIQPGTILDRYGSPNGRFFGEPGATVSQRGMAPGAEAMPYTKYRVLKPLDTQAGPAAGAPQFGATGGAKQYLAGNSIQWLLDNGFIEVVK
jgi:hypothetical protein